MKKLALAATLAGCALATTAEGVQAEPQPLADHELQQLAPCPDPKGCEDVTTDIERQLQNLVNQAGKQF